MDITKSDEYKSIWPHEVLTQLDWHMKDYELYKDSSFVS